MMIFNHSFAQTSAQSENKILLTFDHLVVAVEDLDSAAAYFNSLGFTIKSGRVHANSISNKLIEFCDGSEIELLSVSKPKDELSQWYYDLIKESGEGTTAFIAYRLAELDEAEKLKSVMNNNKINFINTSYGYAEIISFPVNSDLHPIFFIAYKSENNNHIEYCSHINSAKQVGQISFHNSYKSNYEGLFELITDQTLDELKLLSDVDKSANRFFKISFITESIDDVSKKLKQSGIGFLEKQGVLKLIEEKFGLEISFRKSEE